MTTYTRRHTRGTVLNRKGYSWERQNTTRHTDGWQAWTPDPMPDDEITGTLAIKTHKPSQDAPLRHRVIWEPQRILALRNRMGLSQRAFAAELGLAGENRRLTIHRYETGVKTPSDQIVFMLERLEEKLSTGN